MHTYLSLSKSSVFVKATTVFTLVISSLVSFTLMIIKTNKNYGLIGGNFLSAMIIGAVFYFYANSSNKIILEKDSFILKKRMGQIEITKSDILKIQRLAYSNLTMTYGSKGLFGYMGSTMDDAIS